MTELNYEELIGQWHKDRNLIDGSTDKDQYMKLIQEAGELSDSICKNKDIRDDIGDMMVVLVWDGFIVIDVIVVSKSNGKEVVDTILDLKDRHGIPNSNIAFDNDGVGGFIDGFIVGAKEFKNGSTARNGENYANLKTQCFYKSSDRVNNGGVYILEKVANYMYDDKTTIRQKLMQERKCIKKFKADEDGKLRILPKIEMKRLNKGKSPDLMDAFMMREMFELTGKTTVLETTDSAEELGF